MARLAAVNRWALFYVRPKIHMMQHVVKLGKECSPTVLLCVVLRRVLLLLLLLLSFSSSQL